MEGEEMRYFVEKAHLVLVLGERDSKPREIIPVVLEDFLPCVWVWLVTA